ncbi:MAG: hypothetical protein HC767_15740 [Akkermansiaceae bacterium]|nr:hypothetical protein [Akkermansiaceae bacterium]
MAIIPVKAEVFNVVVGSRARFEDDVWTREDNFLGSTTKVCPAFNTQRQRTPFESSRLARFASISLDAGSG